MKLNKNLIYSGKAVDFDVDFQQALDRAQENYEKLKGLSLTASQSHPYLGNYFRLNIADGYVYYQTVEYDNKNKKYLCVRCPGICLDEWQDNYIGNSRWVDADYVESNIQWRVNMEKIFSTK